MYVRVLPPTPKPARTSVAPARETHPQADRLDSVNHANAGRRPSSEQTPRENIFFFPYTFGFCPAPQTPRYHRRRRYTTAVLSTTNHVYYCDVNYEIRVPVLKREKNIRTIL